MKSGGQDRGLGTIGSAQLAETGADVVPGRGRADHQPFGNLLVVQALDDQRQYLAFSCAQIPPSLIGSVLARIRAVVASGDRTGCPA